MKSRKTRVLIPVSLCVVAALTAAVLIIGSPPSPAPDRKHPELTPKPNPKAVQTGCRGILSARYAANQQIVDSAIKSAGEDACAAAHDLGLLGLQASAAYPKMLVEILRRHRASASMLSVAGLGLPEVVTLIATSANVLEDPYLPAFFPLKPTDIKETLQEILALPELARVVAFGGRQCVQTDDGGQGALSDLMFWIDEAQAPDIRNYCSLPQEIRHAMAYAFSRHGPTVVKFIPRIRSSLDRMSKAIKHSLRARAAANALDCESTVPPTDHKTWDDLDVAILATIPRACRVVVERPKAYEKLKQNALATDALADDEGQAQPATRQLEATVAALVHVLDSAVSAETAIIANVADQHPLHTAALFMDHRLTPELRKELVDILRNSNSPATTVVLMVALSEAEPKREAMPTKHGKQPPSTLETTIRTIAARGSVFTDQFKVSSTGDISVSVGESLKGAIPGYTVYRLLREGKSPGASDYVWLAVDVVSLSLALVTFGTSTTAATMAKGAGAGKVLASAARLARRLSRLVHSLVRSAAFRGSTLRFLSTAQGAASISRVIRNPAFVTGACLAQTYAGTRWAVATGHESTLVKHLVGLAGGMLCWRVLGTAGVAAKSVTSPGLVVRVVSTAGAKLSTVQLWGISGKQAVDTFMKWFRGTCLSKAIYSRYMKESVDEALSRLAALGGVISLTHSMIPPALTGHPSPAEQRQ
jgi:hypothetical protein